MRKLIVSPKLNMTNIKKRTDKILRSFDGFKSLYSFKEYHLVQFNDKTRLN